MAIDGAVDVSATVVLDLPRPGRTPRAHRNGEAMECAASLDVLRVRRLIEQARYDRGLVLLEAVVAMLTKMIKVDSST